MNFLLVFVLVVVSIIIHELAHAIAMHKYGIAIKEISLGLGKLFRLGPFRHPKFFGGAGVYATPLLLGASVSPYPTEYKRMEDMPLATRLDVYCAGPWSNIIFGIILLFTYGLITPGFRTSLFQTLLGLVLLLLIWCTYNRHLRKLINHIVLPSIGMALLVFVVCGLLSAPTETVGGPIMMASSTRQYVTGLSAAIFAGAFFSISIGIFNLLPLFPLDGGRIVKAYLETFNFHGFAMSYSVVSGMAFGGLIIWAFGCDILRVLGIIH
jgi:membrane-associated protease RseP (regulator of RpoE activity)